MTTPFSTSPRTAEIAGPPSPHLVLIRDLVYQVAGIFQPDNKMRFLEDRCAKRMQVLAVSTLREYYECLTIKPIRQAEMVSLLNEITVGETCFFRNQPQLDALRNVVLPKIIEARAKLSLRHLRIWSAGCSTGEEPYTLSMMMLEETAGKLKGWTFEILATDLNERSIAHCKRGAYGDYSTRNLTPYFKQKYFIARGDELHVNPEVKLKVNFNRVNLLDNARMAFMKGIDIVLCCNVLIYFDVASKQRVIQHFYNNLLPHGYLFLGHSESLYGISEDFRLVHLPSATAYVRAEKEASETAGEDMSEQPNEMLRKRLDGLEQMPTIPVILAPLLKYLDQPLDQLDVQQVVDLISQDKSLAAQCLHMANSPIFGRWQAVDSVRSAVVALGLQRMRDIAVSCSVIKLSPKDKASMDPVVFWEHSLGCALVCRQFARKIGFPDPSKAYLAGLLHDIGIVAHLWILPREFAATLEVAKGRHVPLHEAELATLGCHHGETGRRVAESWHLAPDLVEAISYHHDPAAAASHRDLVALVGLSDLLCRMSGLGYGYVEECQISFVEEPGFALLLEECPTLQTFDWARFTFELEAYMEEVHRLVTALYRT